MFDSVDVAVRAHREAGAAHHHARDRGDHAGMDAATRRIREVSDYLRGSARADLIHPLTMEWVTAGRDPVAHARYRAQVDALTHPRPRTGTNG